jgi:hypothetical protein
MEEPKSWAALNKAGLPWNTGLFGQKTKEGGKEGDQKRKGRREKIRACGQLSGQSFFPGCDSPLFQGFAPLSTVAGFSGKRAFSVCPFKWMSRICPLFPCRPDSRSATPAHFFCRGRGGVNKSGAEHFRLVGYPPLLGKIHPFGSMGCQSSDDDTEKMLAIKRWNQLTR